MARFLLVELFESKICVDTASFSVFIIFIGVSILTQYFEKYKKIADYTVYLNSIKGYYFFN